MQRYDFLIAGSGLAGLYAAYVASKYGSVAIVTKCKVSDSNTYYAQGGIASVIDIDDSPQLHSDDTITAGRGLCNPDAVAVLVNESPVRIKELIDEGMLFDLSEGGSLALGLEGGHRKRRVLHAGGDITGQRLSEFMTEQILNNPKISLFENHEVLELILSGDEYGALSRCIGLKVWNSEISSQENFYGASTILALGGAAAIYSRTTNPNTSLGNGIAICYKAGCQISDLEFIQFHPTSLYTESNKTYLISEAVRGEGAYLLNSKGERFMKDIHPLAELAPRDIVAQAIDREIKLAKGNPPYVNLSLQHLDSTKIINRFPHIYQRCGELGIDMTDKIPVAPAAHYMVGGVKCDINGKTNVDNLYVCGELASTGIMGANRLASNSLAECLVFGYRAVMSSKELLGEQNKWLNKTEPNYYIEPQKEKLYLKIKNELADIMSRYAGIVRNRGALEQALQKIEKLNPIKESPNLHRTEYYTNAALNLLTVAELIVQGALFREESRGGHFREDFPKEDNFNLYHTVQQRGKKIGNLTANWYKEEVKQESIGASNKRYKSKMDQNSLIGKIIDLAIEEDIATGDVTTNSLIPGQSKATAQFKMKADGVISGIAIIRTVFERFDKELIWRAMVKEGATVKRGDIILEVEGNYRALLSLERISLNILQRMSGIATATKQFVDEIEGAKTKILDTRKTAPGLRILDKMAVAAGGGENHRMGLYDMVLIKDNHIKVAGGITAAVEQIRKNIGSGMKIEVEATSLKEVEEAVNCGVDIIMLDNMENETMKRAVELINGRAETEASGNMSLGRVKEISRLGVDYISVGALTHSVTALDISMNIKVLS